MVVSASCDKAIGELLVDIILTWPIHMDYPLFRESLEDFERITGKIIIAFSDHKRGADLRKFLKPNMPYATFIDAHFSIGQDWRNVAVNEALKLSSASHVLFLEQDFLMSPHFWRTFEYFAETFPPYIAGWKDDTGRLHPSFLYVQRKLLDQTSLDFSANPPEWDHFGKVSRELLELHPRFSDITLYDEEWMHIGGLTQNYNLVMEGKPPNYNLDAFYWYNRASRDAKVEHCTYYIDLSLRAEELREDA